jgi:hypothetical protein
MTSWPDHLPSGNQKTIQSATEWQGIGNQIDAAFIFAGPGLRKRVGS